MKGANRVNEKKRGNRRNIVISRDKERTKWEMVNVDDAALIAKSDENDSKSTSLVNVAIG